MSPGNLEAILAADFHPSPSKLRIITLIRRNIQTDCSKLNACLLLMLPWIAVE
jgi:hypothetical protein